MPKHRVHHASTRAQGRADASRTGRARAVLCAVSGNGAMPRSTARGHALAELKAVRHRHAGPSSRPRWGRHATAAPGGAGHAEAGGTGHAGAGGLPGPRHDRAPWLARPGRHGPGRGTGPGRGGAPGTRRGGRDWARHAGGKGRAAPSVRTETGPHTGLRRRARRTGAGECDRGRAGERVGRG
jgi:hypothetical protein